MASVGMILALGVAIFSAEVNRYGILAIAMVPR